MRGLNRRLERIARMARDRQAGATAEAVDLETWARLFAAARDVDEPGPDDWQAAEAFAAACVRMGTRPTWAALARWAGGEGL
jgi:hypothetical protein